MPKYRFKAVNLEKKTIHGVFVAKDEEHLRDIIANQNYYLVSHRRIPESIQLSLFDKVTIKDLSLFCNQLAVMLEAGMELAKALEMLTVNTVNKKLQKIINDVHSDVLQGTMFSDALSKFPKVFPRFFLNMIKIGEISGRLENILRSLSDYYERDNQTKKKIKSSLAYPIFLICMAIGVLFLIALVVMPMFEDMFKQVGAENLPLITEIVLKVSRWMQANWYYLLAGAGVIGLILFVLRGNKATKRFLDKMAIELPVIKNITIASATTRFTSGMATLLASGVEIIEAMDTMSKLLGNTAIEAKMKIAADEVKRGQAISTSIKTINIFPSLLPEMIAIGEESGSLEGVLTNVSKYYEEELSAAIKKLTSTLEPLTIMFIGVIVVLVLLSVFLPMINLMETINEIATT